MKTLKISNNIIPIGELKTNLSKYINSINDSGNPIVITKNGRATCVLISPAEYDEINYKKELIDSIQKALSDSANDNTFTTSELKQKLLEVRNLRNTDIWKFFGQMKH